MKNLRITLSLISTLILLSAVGCRTIYKSEFVDADGTWFTTELKVGPFSRVEEQIAQMQYSWTPDTGDIAVGQESKGLDSTGQIAATAALVQSIEKIAGIAATGGLGE